MRLLVSSAAFLIAMVPAAWAYLPGPPSCWPPEADWEIRNPLASAEPIPECPTPVERRAATSPVWASDPTCNSRAELEVWLEPDGTIGKAIVVRETPLGEGAGDAAIRFVTNWLYAPGDTHHCSITADFRID